MEKVMHPACAVCKKVDDHPRHIIITRMDVQPLAPPGADQGTLDQLDAIYNRVVHIDCCNCHDDPAVSADMAERGVETCAQILARAGDKRGAAFREFYENDPRRHDLKKG